MKRLLVFIMSLFLGFSPCLIIPCQQVLAEEQGKIVSSIEVKGTETTDPNSVLLQMKTKPGSIYYPYVISEDIKRIYATGMFDDVKVDTFDDGEGKVKLVVHVKERNAVGDIYVKGNRIFSRKKIIEFLGIEPGQFYNERDLKIGINNIKAQYAVKGYHDVTIMSDVAEKDGRKDIYLLIEEGKRERVGRIYFYGNKVVPKAKLYKVISSRTASFFRSGVLNEETIKSDTERIRQYYVDLGFLDAKVDYTITPFKKDLMAINFYITEGPRYKVGKIDIAGSKEFSKDEILSWLNVRPGDVFSPSKIREEVNTIQRHYFSRGYIFAQVLPKTVPSQNNQLDIVYEVREGTVAYVNEIKIKGNVKTKDKVIRRELRIYPGDKIEQDKLDRSQQRLVNLGYFEGVGFDIEDTDEPDKKNLIVDVKEAKTGEFAFGAGYSSVDKFVGFVSVTQNNFDITNFPSFTGGGQRLTLRFEGGETSNEYTISFTEPYIFDSPYLFGVDAFNYTHDKETDVGYGYQESRKGGALRLGKQVSEYSRLDSKLQYEKVKIGDIDTTATSALLREEGENTLHTFSLKWMTEKRDNVYVPKEGYYFTIGADVAGGPLGGDKDFYRFTTDAATYLTLFNEDNVLELRARFGLISEFGDSDWVPIYERFFAGGANTIRGYRERKVGPLDAVTGDPIGGEAYAVGNIELTMPLFEYVKWAMFSDFGNVWADSSDFGKGGLYYSVGLGVRIKTPIGPIRLDYGYPLKKEPGSDKKSGRFHFSMSHGF